jgi:hypothetical protein
VGGLPTTSRRHRFGSASNAGLSQKAVRSDKSKMAMALSISGLAALTRAAARFAGAVARRAGVGAVHPRWMERATVCERCPMRVAVGRVSYCGQPLHRKPERDEAQEGCGCPTREKAKDPGEHCPITVRHRAARQHALGCDCKWCGIV